MKVTKLGMIVLFGIGLVMGALAGARAETLKIGVIAPLTGGGAPWGMVAAGAPKILAAEINAQGGLEVGGKKYQVEVIAYDDQYKAADAVAAYNRLVNQDGVKFMIILASPSTMALKQQLEDDKIVALTSAATAKAIDPNTRYLFRLLNMPIDYVPPFIHWLHDNLKERRVVIINPNDETGWDQGQFAEKQFKANGFTVVGDEVYERSTKDFEPMLTKIIAMGPEIIDLGGGPPATSGLIVRQARELGYKGKIVKTSGPSVKEIISAAGNEGAEGVLNLIYVDTNKDGFKHLSAEFRKTVNQEPNEMIVTFYDGANVLLHAIQAAGDVNDTTKVAAAFAKALPMKSIQGDMLTLGGKETSGADQQIMTVDLIAEIRNGQPVVVGKAFQP